MSISELAGAWTYRSFRNDPDPVDGDPQKAIDLFFAEAAFQFEALSETEFGGAIDWGSSGLDMAGRLVPGSPDTPTAVSIVGTGRPGSQTDGWQYDYHGCVARRWPNGVGQIASLVGMVIRTKSHNGAPTGHTASFVAVKRP